MIYFRSTLIGLAAVLLTFGVLPLLVISIGLFVLAISQGGLGIGVSVPHWNSESPAHICAQLLVFAIGFVWELRRLKRRAGKKLPA
jgi:hypothetical protein